MEEQRLLEARRLSQQHGHSLDQQQQQAGYSLEQQQQMAVLEEEMAVALDSSRKISKEMIVDLVPGPVTLLMNGGGSTGAGKSGAATTKSTAVGAGAARKTAGLSTTTTTKKTTVASTSSSTSANKKDQAGEKTSAPLKKAPASRSARPRGVEQQADPNRPQYLHLSLDQIQELALKQQAGTLSAVDLQQQQHHHLQHQEQSTCAVHCHAAPNTTTAKKPTATNAATNGNGRKPLAATNKENKNNKQNASKSAKTVAAAVPSLQSPNLIKNMKGVGKQEGGSKPALAEQNKSNAAAKSAVAGNGVAKKSPSAASNNSSGGGALESPGLIKDLCAATAATETCAQPGNDADKKMSSSSSPERRQASPTRKASPVRKRSPVAAAPASVAVRSASPATKPKAKSTSTMVNGTGSTSQTKDQRKASTESGSSVSSNKENETTGRRTSAPSATTATDVKVREKTLKREDMLFAGGGGRKSKSTAASSGRPKDPTPMGMKATTTEVTAKGGFLAPTQAWLSHMGEKLDFKSRSPSPSRREGQISATVVRKPLDRSPSPRQRRPGGTRDSSVDSGARRQQATSVSTVKSAPRRNPPERDPSLPKIRRSGSLRATTNNKPDEAAPQQAATVAVKRSASLRKQASDLSGAALHARKQPAPKLAVAPKGGASAATRLANGIGGGGAKSTNGGGKTAANAKSAESKVLPPQQQLTLTAKKEPPPVPPKPDKDRWADFLLFRYSSFY